MSLPRTWELEQKMIGKKQEQIAQFLQDRLWSMCSLNEIDPDQQLEKLLEVNPEACDLAKEDKAIIRTRVLELIESDRTFYMVNGADVANLKGGSNG